MINLLIGSKNSQQLKVMWNEEDIRHRTAGLGCLIVVLLTSLHLEFCSPHLQSMYAECVVGICQFCSQNYPHPHFCKSSQVSCRDLLHHCQSLWLLVELLHLRLKGGSVWFTPSQSKQRIRRSSWCWKLSVFVQQNHEIKSVRFLKFTWTWQDVGLKLLAATLPCGT